MKKFIVIYHAPAEATAQMANVTPEQREEGMKPWMAWAQKCGSQLVDLGAPLVGGKKLNPDGTSKNSSREVCGYSILEAEDMEAAQGLLQRQIFPPRGVHADRNRAFLRHVDA